MAGDAMRNRAAAAARAANSRIEKKSPVEKRTYLSEVLARRPRGTRQSKDSQPFNLPPSGALSPASRDQRTVSRGMEALAGRSGEGSAEELGDRPCAEAQVLDRIAALACRVMAVEEAAVLLRGRG